MTQAVHDLGAAISCYARAASRAASVPERDYFLLRAARLGDDKGADVKPPATVDEA